MIALTKAHRLVADTERRGDHQQHDGGDEQRAAERSSRRRCGRHLLVVRDDCEDGEKQHRLPVEDLARQQQDVDVHREEATGHQPPGAPTDEHERSSELEGDREQGKGGSQGRRLDD